MNRAGESRIVELSSPGLALLRALEAAGVGAAIGTGYAFLAVLVVGIVGEEALSTFFWRLDLDPLFRASMGVLLVVALVLGVVVPPLFLIDRFVVLRVAERHAAASGGLTVPTATFRSSLSTIPGQGLASAGIVVIVTAGTLAAIVLGMLVFDEDLREEPVGWIGFLLFAGLVGAGWMMKVVSSRVTARTEPRVRAVKQRWSQAIREADRADAARRDAAPLGVLPRVVTSPSGAALSRSALVVLTVALVAVGVFTVSVFLRQQCRGCDPITWIDPVETGIDVLSLASGGALLLCAVAGSVMWLGSVLLQRIRERSVRAWVADGAPRRVAEEQLAPFLTGMRAAERLARALAAVGAAALVFATGADWSGWREADPLPGQIAGASAIIAAAVVSILDVPRARAERQALRNVTFPGDVGRPRLKGRTGARRR